MDNNPQLSVATLNSTVSPLAARPAVYHVAAFLSNPHPASIYSNINR